MTVVERNFISIMNITVANDYASKHPTALQLYFGHSKYEITSELRWAALAAVEKPSWQRACISPRAGR